MDSTFFNIECVEGIVDAAGRKTEVAMRGEITDYKDSPRQRVALPKGVTEEHLAHVYRSRLRLRVRLTFYPQLPRVNNHLGLPSGLKPKAS